jgi:hypothetical protein
VADRFVVVDRAAANRDGARRPGDGTGAPASGTGLLGAEPSELGPEELLDGPPDHGLSDVDGQGLDRIEVQIAPRSVLAEGPLGDDRSPPVGHLAKLGPILGRALGEGHRWFVLELGEPEELENEA